MYNLVIHERVTGDHIADWHTDVIEFNGIDVNVFIDTDTDNIASYLAYVATRTDLVQTREQRNIGDTVVIIHTWRTKS